MKLRTIEDVHELMGAPTQAAFFVASLKTGLFWLLKEQPRSSAAIAQEMKISPRRCHHWLRLLAAMNLLEQEGDHFRPSPVAWTAILDVHTQETWKMLAIDAGENLEDSLLLAQCLSDASSGKDSAGQDRYQLDPYVQKMAKDLDRARLFTQMLYELHKPLALEVALALEVNGACNLMDVGGGSGVVSLALLRKHPQLKATVVDIANVCTAGREIADKLPEKDRISYYPLNFVEDEPPKKFDIILICDAGIFDDSFLEKMAGSLNEGGRLVIVDRWFDMGQNETARRLAYVLGNSLRNPEYSLRSLEDIGAGLVQAGLEVESIVALQYGNGNWKLIYARKRVPSSF
ncbi:MAG: methyltransferase [Anaerolineaceae bacterium]|nr:MAG: methyltransferase [Anaerolineaceae bacterium]